jgi:hypothetical protein
MPAYLIVNSVGLFLGILGALLVAICGLPNEKALTALLRGGEGGFSLGIPPTAEAKARGRRLVRRYEWIGRIGLGIMMVGFGLQLQSNFTQPALFITASQPHAAPSTAPPSSAPATAPPNRTAAPPRP